MLMKSRWILIPEARCCKLFGLWVAEQLGLEGADAETYAKSVVEAKP